MKGSPDLHTRQLQFLCSLYQIDQLIDEPTKVTKSSATLTDLVLTNTKDNISASGVIHRRISDHSLIYIVRNFTLPKRKSTVKEVRDCKHFNAEYFIADLSWIIWDMLQQFHNPIDCLWIRKSFFDETLSWHEPLQHKRIMREFSSLDYASYLRANEKLRL